MSSYCPLGAEYFMLRGAIRSHPSRVASPLSIEPQASFTSINPKHGGYPQVNEGRMCDVEANVDYCGSDHLGYHPHGCRTCGPTI